jgi:hypothetical protein
VSTSVRKGPSVRWNRGVVFWTIGFVVIAGYAFWRGAWVDGILFALVVAMFVVDELTGGRIHLLKQPVTAPKWLILSVSGALGALLVVAPRHSWFDLLGMIVVGLAVLLFAWVPDPPRPGRPASATRASAVAWSVLVTTLCLWEALAFVLSRTSLAAEQEFPTVSFLVDPFVSWPGGRIIFVCLWLLGGLGLLRVWSRP